MKNYLVLLLLICSTSALAGWTSAINPKHQLSPGRVNIAYSPDQTEGVTTFKDALDGLADDGFIHRLEIISLHWLLEDANFQRELMSALQESAPNALAEALRSTGRMNNPKVVQLIRPFETSVLTTPTVTQINADLAPYGLLVSGATTEKFSLVGSDQNRKFKCFLWLTVSPR